MTLFHRRLSDLDVLSLSLTLSHITLITYRLNLASVQLGVAVALAALFYGDVVYDVLQNEDGGILEELVYVQACQCRSLYPVVQFVLPSKG